VFAGEGDEEARIGCEDSKREGGEREGAEREGAEREGGEGIICAPICGLSSKRGMLPRTSV